MRIEKLKLANTVSGKLENISLSPAAIANDKNSQDANYYTYLVGNNGSYKSLVLSEIANAICNPNSTHSQVEMDFKPNKVICISTGLTDRFPKIFLKPEEQLHLVKDSDFITNFSAQNYFYFGPSTGKYTISKRIMLKRLFLNILSVKNSHKVFEAVKRALTESGFSSEIRVTYKFSRDFIKSFENSSHKDPIQKYIRSLLSFSKYRGFAKNLKFDQEAVESIAKNLKSLYSKNIIKKSIVSRIDLRSERGSKNFFTKVLPTLLLLEHVKAVSIQEFAVTRDHNNEKSNSNYINLLDLSSGEFKRLFLFLSIACSVEDDSLILIDEPEISSHPAWQLSFSNDLQEFLKDTKSCHCIIATHSPYIISASPNNTSSVLSLKKKENSFIAEEYPSPFGSSIEQILLDIFGVATIRNYYFEERVRKILLAIQAFENGNQPQNISEIHKDIEILSKFISDENDPLSQVLKTAKLVISGATNA